MGQLTENREKESQSRVVEDLRRFGVITLLAVTIVLMVIAIFDRNSHGEAPIGSFETQELNEGWMLVEGNKEREVTLPTRIDRKPGETIRIARTLPADLADGSHLMIRSAMEDVRIYVDGDCRAEYASDLIPDMSFYIPSAYVVAEVDAADAGREVLIEITVKTAGAVSEVRIGPGNNVWFSVIRDGLIVNSLAFTTLIAGLILLLAAGIVSRFWKTGSALALGLLMIDVALWVLSESTLRQFLFRRPSMSQFFSYYTVELIGVLACMYFDEVQHRLYHRRYLAVECAAFLQILLNILLHAAGIVPLYRTLLISHIWLGVCAVTAIAGIVTDIRRKRVREYRIACVGMTAFVVLALAEMVGFYVNRFHVFGTYVCFGMILLLVATVIQIIYDEVKTYSAREKATTEMTFHTIETIANAIDARDEYTGGHSDRVAVYAARLAREMAADYEFSEEDILRVRYIGLVHDIGKIGVSDSVLNKPGRLTEEEYSLMKTHTEIGYEVMQSLGAGIPGLTDGIRYHHERFDGKGYPDGLSDTEIPLIARILSIADAYDAMTSNRVYRRRLSDEEVRTELARCSGTQFDPALTDIFLRLLDEGELNVATVRGIAADENGIMRLSSVLENRMHADLHRDKEVENPSHVRMLCYIMKLMENKGRPYQVFFIGVGREETASSCDRASEQWQQLSDAVREQIGPHDIDIRYTASRNVVALFDQTPEQAKSFIRGIREKCPSVMIDPLT
ncbi:MAG: HD-GYP domain-containing protein [Lachnospiraceae bacterium]|nr:HD-GYP domain-containing protein [Lachnospiraceae bacterium]